MYIWCAHCVHCIRNVLWLWTDNNMLMSMPPPPSSMLMLPSSLIWVLLLYFFCRFCDLYWWSATNEKKGEKNWMGIFFLHFLKKDPMLTYLTFFDRSTVLFNGNKNAASYRLRHRRRNKNIFAILRSVSVISARVCMDSDSVFWIVYI